MISPSGHYWLILYTYIEYVGEERSDTLAYRCSSNKIEDMPGNLFALLLLEKVTGILNCHFGLIFRGGDKSKDMTQSKSPQFEEEYQPGTEGFQTRIR